MSLGISIVIFIVIYLFLNKTKPGAKIRIRMYQGFMVWKYKTFEPWKKRNRDTKLFKYFEKANWFKWYGRKLVHVKPKDRSKLQTSEKAVLQAMKEKDYKMALTLLDLVPTTRKNVQKHEQLRQLIEGKLK